MQPLQMKIEDWKTRLIDLSKRNKLLNFKQTRLSTLHLLKPDSDEIFSALGEGTAECKLLFDEDLFAGCDEEIRLDTLTLKKNEFYAQTLSEKSQKTLRHLLSKSKESLEEQGINTLFCTFGLCKWMDPKEPEKALLAPLVMIPIQINRQTLTGPYKISKFEEDIIVNPAFMKQLKELGIDMTPIENLSLNDIEEQKGEAGETEQPVLKQFFDLFRETIKGQKGWEVLQACYLGLFNYHKFVMVKDIENNVPMIEQNRFLKAIATGVYEKGQEDVCEIPEIDDLDPQSQFQILDADASQQEAIEAVKCAKDLIIQGPPGTGKSQTIVNIISEAIAQDKKILFVSEKQAALTVVKRRLDEHQLGPFCLELHSKMASKDMVYRQFADVLKLLGVESQGNQAFDFEQLQSVKNNLIGALQLFQKPYGQRQITPHQLFDELIALELIPDVPFTFDDFLTIDDAFLKKAQVQLGTIDDRAKALFPSLEKAAPIQFKGFERNAKESFVRMLQQMRQTTNELLSLCDQDRFKTWQTEKHRLLEQIQLNGSQAERLREKLQKATADEWAPVSDSLGILAIKDQAILSQYNRALERIQPVSNEILKDVNAFSSLIGASTLAEHASVDDLDALCDFLSRTKIEILNLDLNRLIELWNTRYHSFFGRLFGGFRKNSAIIGESFRNPADKGQKDIPAHLNQARQIRKWLDSGIRFSDKGILPIIRQIQSHLGELKNALSELHEGGERLADLLNSQLIRVEMSQPAHNTANDESLYQWYEAVHQHYGALMDLKDHSLGYYHWAQADTDSQLDAQAFREDLDDLLAIMDRLTEIEDLQNTCAGLKELGLENFIHNIIRTNIPTEHYYLCFKKGIDRAFIEHIYSQSESLYFFKSQDYWRDKETFKQLDVLQLKNNRRRIAQKRIDLNPKYDFLRECDSDLSRLKREIMKKRWKMPIRKLFAAIPRLVQMLKPCMLMSPLSVSHFLDSSKIQFDLVVFDEASQVFPEDAVGSIMRAKQVVVVGDNKQLPPTAFFKNTDYEMDRLEDEEDYFAVNLESILDEASVIGIEHKSLLWHYRSRNEQLIHFSNHHFYDGHLVTFPSNHYDDGDYGVYLDYLPGGVYDRGKTRTNPSEVQRITEIVMAFAKTHPDKSLGIVTFNEAQKDAITERIENARLSDQTCEGFFNDERNEPFFVKNLESVQGDERDVIVFSIGYGKDENGKMYYNFGPLNREGGERRLNVAVTRAKEKVVVVSSITYRDIPPEKLHGLKYLREYLMFAEHLEENQVNELQQYANQSAFEEDVKQELESLGYHVDLHVGSSKYKVDIAIKKRESDNSYCLGIECDTSKQLKAKTIRDRERIRETVLEKLGWKIAHLWIKEWYENKEKVIDKIIDQIQSDDKKNSKQDEFHEMQGNSEDFFIEKDEENNDSHLFENYKHFSEREFLTYIKGEKPNLKNLLENILEKETPIIFIELFRKLNQFHAQLCSSMDQLPNIFEDYLTEKGNLSRSSIMKLIEDLEENYLFDNDFIIDTSKPIQPRKRDEDSVVDIDHIHPSEREAMMKMIIRHAAFIHAQDLIFETSRQFGFNRTGEKIRALLYEDIDSLLEKNEIIQQGEKLTLEY